MHQNAPELQWRIKHLGAIVWSRKKEPGNVSTLPVTKRAYIFSALAGLAEEGGGENDIAPFKEKLCSSFR